MVNRNRQDACIRRCWIGVIGTLFSVALMPAMAADEPENDADEVTITVLEEGATPADIISIIELPEAAAEEGVEASRKGLDTANRNREEADGRADDRDDGRPEAAALPEAAEEARNRADAAREGAESAADNASEDVLDRVGSRNVDNLPEDVRERLPDNLPDPEDRPQPPPPPGRDGG